MTCLILLQADNLAMNVRAVFLCLLDQVKAILLTIYVLQLMRVHLLCASSCTEKHMGSRVKNKIVLETCREAISVVCFYFVLNFDKCRCTTFFLLRGLSNFSIRRRAFIHIQEVITCFLDAQFSDNLFPLVD